MSHYHKLIAVFCLALLCLSACDTPPVIEIPNDEQLATMVARHPVIVVADIVKVDDPPKRNDLGLTGQRLEAVSVRQLKGEGLAAGASFTMVFTLQRTAKTYDEEDQGLSRALFAQGRRFVFFLVPNSSRISAATTTPIGYIVTSPERGALPESPELIARIEQHLSKLTAP